MKSQPAYQKYSETSIEVVSSASTFMFAVQEMSPRSFLSWGGLRERLKSSHL